MPTDVEQLDRLRQAMALQGMSQKKLAAAMGLPQSAISNLLTGKRQIKVDELHRLEHHLGIVSSGGTGLEPIPLIDSSDVINFEDASKKAESFFPGLFRDKGTRLFAFIEYEPRLQMERMRKIHFVIDPDEQRLRKNSIYVLVENGKYQLVDYKDDPPRFESMWDPSWEPGSRLVGSFPFTILGTVRQFGWRGDM